MGATALALPTEKGEGSVLKKTRILVFILCFALVAACLSGCSPHGQGDAEKYVRRLTQEEGQVFLAGAQALVQAGAFPPFFSLDVDSSLVIDPALGEETANQYAPSVFGTSSFFAGIEGEKALAVTDLNMGSPMGQMYWEGTLTTLYRENGVLRQKEAPADWAGFGIEGDMAFLGSALALLLQEGNVTGFSGMQELEEVDGMPTPSSCGDLRYSLCFKLGEHYDFEQDETVGELSPTVRALFSDEALARFDAPLPARVGREGLSRELGGLYITAYSNGDASEFDRLSVHLWYEVVGPHGRRSEVGVRFEWFQRGVGQIFSERQAFLYRQSRAEAV